MGSGTSPKMDSAECSGVGTETPLFFSELCDGEGWGDMSFFDLVSTFLRGGDVKRDLCVFLRDGEERRKGLCGIFGWALTLGAVFSDPSGEGG
jgi:hypothetical protein